MVPTQDLYTLTIYCTHVQCLSVCLSVFLSVSIYSMSETVSIMTKHCVQNRNQELLKRSCAKKCTENFKWEEVLY